MLPIKTGVKGVEKIHSAWLKLGSKLELEFPYFTPDVGNVGNVSNVGNVGNICLRHKAFLHF